MVNRSNQNASLLTWGFLLFLLLPGETPAAGWPCCGVGLIPVADLWILSWLFHMALGQSAALWPISPRSKYELVKLLHGLGPGCSPPHRPHVILGFHWTTCIPLSCFVPDLSLLKFLLPWELDSPGLISFLGPPFSLFSISPSSMMRATLTLP